MITHNRISGFLREKADREKEVVRIDGVGMETNYGTLVSLLSCLCVASVVVVCIVSGHYSQSIKFSGAEPGDSVATIEFQTKVTASHEVRAVFSSQPPAFYVNRLRNHTLIRKIKKRTRYQGQEEGLARARASIRKAFSNLNRSSEIDGEENNEVPTGDVYRNAGAFYQSYVEMEKRLKVYVYEEGEVPMIHDGPCKDIYTIEGRFIHEIEHGDGKFRTRDAERAHVYFMPFSVTWMVKYLYKPLTYNLTPLRQLVSDYVSVISTKYPFWNTTQGADHFMLACHDWGPHASRGHPVLYNTSIRVLCNANTSEGFNPQKDVSLPEIHLYGGNVNPKLLSPPPPNSPRPFLAFFAGGLHGPIRPILLQHWMGRDTDLRVYKYLPKDMDYYSLMLQSKYCLCPSGHEVASPRIVEAIYSECVPVILSDHYVLPFSDVLRWEAFSVKVEASEIPRLKEVLQAISEEKYTRLKEGVRAVRRHFELNQPAKRFDVFHMILHSVWLRRINLKLG